MTTGKPVSPRLSCRSSVRHEPTGTSWSTTIAKFTILGDTLGVRRARLRVPQAEGSRGHRQRL